MIVARRDHLCGLGGTPVKEGDLVCEICIAYRPPHLDVETLGALIDDAVLQRTGRDLGALTSEDIAADVLAELQAADLLPSGHDAI